MALHATSPLLILRRFTYTTPEQAERLRREGNGDRVVAHKDGSLVEAVELYDPATGSQFTATVDPSVNGEAAALATGNATLEHTATPEARTRPQGGTYTTTRHKFRLVGFKATAAPAGE
jgi:hypothetical protein